MQRRDDIVDNSPLSTNTGTTTEAMGRDTSDLQKRDFTATAQDKATDLGGKAQEKAVELGDKAQEKADEGMNKAAGGMESAADKLRERAEHSDGVTAQAGTKAADAMEKTAGYLREKDTTAVLDDVETYVREHPMQALAGAIVGGFVIGRVLR